MVVRRRGQRGTPELLAATAVAGAGDGGWRRSGGSPARASAASGAESEEAGGSARWVRAAGGARRRGEAAGPRGPRTGFAGRRQEAGRRRPRVEQRLAAAISSGAAQTCPARRMERG